MTESQFIAENIEDWEDLERLLKSSNRDADRLQELFLKISGDLSYASSFYPNRSVRLYLNKLTQQVFDTIEKESKSKFDFSKVSQFFKYTLPLEMYRSRKAFLLSFVVFVLSFLIGALSTANSEEFASLILGHDYVSMTESNINDGDPMAVYKDADQVDMFLGITINNIRVSFYAFVGGILAGLGTFILLLYNGIMVGAFQFFFYKKGLLATSFFTIWIHGTIEISAIIIAGAAGFVLGSGLLFPGTYKRSVSLQVSAKRAVRIIVGIIPLFIMAGFLESFVTRLTDMPLIFKALIIIISLLLIICLYVVYPWWVHKYHGKDFDYGVQPQKTISTIETSERKLSLGEMLEGAFTMYRMVSGRYFTFLFKWVMPILAACYIFWMINFFHEGNEFDYQYVLFNYDRVGLVFYFIYLFVTSFLIVVNIMLYCEQSELKIALYLKKHLLKTMLLTAVPLAVFYFFPWWAVLLVIIFLPPQFIVCSIYDDNSRLGKGTYTRSFHIVGFVLFHILILGLLHFLLFLVINVGIGDLLYRYILWHDVFSVSGGTMVFVRSLLYIFINFAMLPLYIFGILYSYKSYLATSQAIDLKEKFKLFGTQSHVFE